MNKAIVMSGKAKCSVCWRAAKTWGAWPKWTVVDLSIASNLKILVKMPKTS